METPHLGARRGAARGCGDRPHARSRSRSPPPGSPWALPLALRAEAAACAGSLIMKGKVAPSPLGSEAGAFVWEEVQTALSTPPPPGQKEMRAWLGEALKAPGWLLRFVLFLPIPKLQALGRKVVPPPLSRLFRGRGGGRRCLCKFGFAGAPAPRSARAPPRACGVENRSKGAAL